MTTTCVSLFAGGGLGTVGVMGAGFTPVGAVEIEQAYAASYERNIGAITVAPVQDTDPKAYDGVDLVFATPSCKTASVANPSAGETENDLICAKAVCRYLRELKPRYFMLENVAQYEPYASFALIIATLHDLKYDFHYAVYNAADYAVPQTRRRLILRAVREGRIAPMTPTHSDPKLLAKTQGQFSMFDDAPTLLPWNGWYGAIEDLIPSLPESAFADWQLARLPDELFSSCLIENQNTARDATRREWHEPSFTLTGAMCGRRQANKPTAWLIEGDAAGDRPPTRGESAEPCFTLKTSAGGRVHRAFLMGVNGENGLLRLSEPSAPTIAANHAAMRYRAFLVGDQKSGDGGILGRAEDAPVWTIDTRVAGKTRAFMVEGKPANFQGDLQVTHGVPPCVTVTASEPKHPKRAWLDRGIVVRMIPRCLGRFQTLPDWYVLPEKETVASTIIGNGIPCELACAAAETFLQ